MSHKGNDPSRERTSSGRDSVLMPHTRYLGKKNHPDAEAGMANQSEESGFLYVVLREGSVLSPKAGLGGCGIISSRVFAQLCEALA